MSVIHRFINTHIPTEGCNLRCEYCYIRQHGNEDSLATYKSHAGSRFRFSVEHMLEALSVERMGGVCLFHLTGSGETFLCPEIIDITKGLLDNGHYVSFTSNCTIAGQIRRLTELPKPYRERLFIKASFPYCELKKRGMLMKFVENINLLKAHGIAYSIEIVSSDHILSELDELKLFSLKHFGALPHVLTGRDEQVLGSFPRIKTRLTSDEYNSTWSSFDSDLFSYQQEKYDMKYDGFCYAGFYTGSLSLVTGDFSACPGNRKITNFFEDLESPILFAPVGECPFIHCFCGFFQHVFVGVIREYDSGVRFYQFRDRICADGSHWLTPSMREIFSHRCVDNYLPYTDMQTLYFTWLMRKIYKNEDPPKSEKMKLNKIISDALRSKKIKKIAVYGMGAVGKWMINILENSYVEIVCAIDRRFYEIPCELPVQSPEYPLPEIDGIVVTIYAEFTNIAPILRKKTDVPILSIIDLIPPQINEE